MSGTSILPRPGKNKPPYVKGPYIDSRGELRAQFRRPGYPMHGCNLPLPIWSDAFMEVYRKAVSDKLDKSEIGKAKTVPGSFSDLIGRYYQTPEFLNLASITRQTYRNDMERFRKDHGDKGVAALTTEHVEGLLARKAATPAAANRLRKTLKIFMTFAIKKRFRSDNPLTGVKKLKDRTTGFRTWNEEEIAQYYAAHPKGSKPRLAMDLLLAVGARRGDVVRLGWQHVRGGFLTYTQDKTGTEVAIPVKGRFAEVLAALKRDRMTFVVTEFGKPYTPDGFGNWFAKCVKQAGLPTGLAAHGLRKAACVRLAEAGCSAIEIMAISGHRDLREVQVYVEAASRKKLATSAVDSVAHFIPADEREAVAV